MFYEFKKYFISEKGESSDFISILPDKITVIPYAHFDDPCGRNSNKTIFKEVQVRPFRVDDKMDFIIKKFRGVSPKRNIEWRRDIYNALKRNIENTWDSSKFHVVLHTSGIDSRLLSMMIKELRIELGDEWLGDVLFLENGGEGHRMKEIMECEGWEKDKYMVYNEQSVVGNYHEYGLRFNDMWKKAQGVVSYPYNYFYDSIIHLQEQGVIPAEFQGYSGFGAYIEDLFKGKRIAEWLKRDYYYQMNQFNRIGEWHFPFWGKEYISKLINTTEILRLGRTRIADAIYKDYYMPVPPITHEELLARGYRHVGDNLLGKLHDQYKASWYGKHVDVMPNPYIYYTDWWGHYHAASLCEHLLEMGYKLKYRR